jgi:phosphoribosylanthranilate isomerase
MHIKTKICGLTNLEDARVAVEAGADFLGFNLYPKSSRYIAPDPLGDLLAALLLPPHVQTVGIFVNTPTDEVRALLDSTGLMLAQLHGDEDEATVAALADRAFKALRPVSAEDARQSARFAAYPASHAPQILLDAYHPSAYGGTGELGNWALAAEVAHTLPRLLLAGGLNADNVGRAIATVAPWGVDVASGVESAPGRKDHAQMRAFIANAHAVAPRTP